MPATIEQLYRQLCYTPFPALGQAGNFGSYDGLLSGCASRATRGERIPPAEIPDPDQATSRLVTALRARSDINREEQAFLQYFDLLEQIRLELHRQS